MKRKEGLKMRGEYFFWIVFFVLASIAIFKYEGKSRKGVVFETRMPDTVVAKCCYCLKENTYTNFVKIK